MPGAGRCHYEGYRHRVRFVLTNRALEARTVPDRIKYEIKKRIQLPILSIFNGIKNGPPKPAGAALSDPEDASGLLLGHAIVQQTL